jgi:hypothetical protein
MMKNRIANLAVALALSATGFAVASPEVATPLDLYTRMHSAMAADSVEGVAAAATDLAAAVRAKARSAKDATVYEALAAAADRMQGADLAALREQFKEVSRAFAAYVNTSGTAGAQLFYCPMADGYWMQNAADAGAKNPYYGKSMLRCGTKVDKVEG